MTMIDTGSWSFDHNTGKLSQRGATTAAQSREQAREAAAERMRSRRPSAYAPHALTYRPIVTDPEDAA